MPTPDSPVLAALYDGDADAAESAASGRDLDVCEAAALGDVGALRGLVGEDGPGSVAARSADDFTALHLAAFFSGSAAAARVLLEAGADVDAEAAPGTGLHPLHSAAAVGHAEIVGLLLDHGAEPDAVQVRGFTALHAAAANGDDASVSRLLRAGADPARVSADGRTPSAMALERGHPETAALLDEAARPAPSGG